MTSQRTGRRTVRPRKRGRAMAETASPETLPAGIRPLYLHEEFATAAPAKFAGPSGLIGKLSLTQMRFALWGKCEGLSAIRISEALGISLGTVKELWMKARRDPGIFLDCRFIHKVRLGQTKSTVRWWCRFCGAMYRGPSPAADHAHDHAYFKDDNF